MFAASKTASVSGGYQISRSLRFNSADTTYLNRTPASAGNRKTWTYSTWMKLGVLGTNRMFFSSFASATDTQRLIAYFDTNNRLSIDAATTAWRTTTQVFRDTSAWYHIVFAFDTTQATANDRIKLYINGSQVTAFDITANPTQNADTAVNATYQHDIGARSNANDLPYDGYITETYLIDGQALTPSSFGETNAQTGVWQPKAYSGSYGTNGFYLNFSDNSNTTAATLGKDYSGNGNNWTPNNFSVTAGAGNDSLVDSPTSYGTDTGVGGTVRGNYATINALITPTSSATISNGNLSASFSVWRSVFGTMPIPTSGKWYWEINSSYSDALYGIAVASSNLMAARDTYFTGSVVSYGYYGTSGNKNSGPSNTSAAYGATFTSGDVIGVALDMDAGTLVFYKNGTSQGTAFTGLTDTYVPAMAQSGVSCDVNFGQRPFAYTAPSGYKALCTQNLPTPTIGATTATQAGKYFNPVTYTGTGATQSVTVGFQPDWVWIKNRTNGANWHVLTDSVRGIQKEIYTNSTAAEATLTTTGVNQFNSSGFQILGGSGDYNRSADNYVAWNWKANGTGSTNTSGSITSTVSANTTSGFSIATFTGNGTAGATVGHGLGVAPSMIIIKSRSNARNWLVYHSAIGATKFLQLDTTIAATTATTPWNDTAPTSTVFSLGTSAAGNESGFTRVAYCFAEVAGYSKFGSFTGNGSADGPFVYCGFRPAYLLVKRSDSTYDWWVFDNKRLGYNATSYRLAPDLSDAEYTTGPILDLTSNGFKIRDASQGWNGSGGTIIFAAFAESPFKYSLAR